MLYPLSYEGGTGRSLPAVGYRVGWSVPQSWIR